MLTLMMQGSTALHKASEYGFAPICKALLDAGADIDPKNSDGLTPLSIAASHAHVLSLIYSFVCYLPCLD